MSDVIWFDCESGHSSECGFDKTVSKELFNTISKCLQFYQILGHKKS